MENYLTDFTGIKISLPMAVLLTGASLFAIILVTQSLFAFLTPG
jgi:hypothetical protein